MSGYNISPQLDRNKYFTVNLSEIEGRLDPFFYRPIFSSYKVKSKPLKSFANAINHPPEYERIYSEKGFQLLRAQNVKPTGIEIDNNPVFFNEEFLKGKKLFIPEIGDVLVVRSGVNAGDTAIIEENYEKVIIGADNLLVKVNEKIIPKFLQVFFFTAYGKTLMNRYLTGATNKHINPANLGKIPVPIIDIKTQKKSIEIFETALLQKKNNELASIKLLAGIDEYLINELDIALPEPPANTLKNRIYMTSIKNISGNRYDPYYHQGMFNQLDIVLSSRLFIKFADFIDIITKGETPLWKGETYVPDGVPFLKVQNISINGIQGELTYITKELHNSMVRSKLKGGELLYSMAGSIGVATYLPNDFGEANINQAIAKIILKEEISINKNYLLEVLNSYICNIQAKRFLTVAAQPNINFEQIKAIRIPMPPLEKQQEIAKRINAIRQQAQALKQQTQLTLQKANEEIEQIILKGN